MSLSSNTEKTCANCTGISNITNSLGSSNNPIAEHLVNALLSGTDVAELFTDNVTELAANASCEGANSSDCGLPAAPPVRQYSALILIVIPILSVFGNILVILSVWRERSLQSATNYFIVSLAVADLLVSAAVMPFAVYVQVSPTPWRRCM